MQTWSRVEAGSRATLCLKLNNEWATVAIGRFTQNLPGNGQEAWTFISHDSPIGDADAFDDYLQEPRMAVGIVSDESLG